MKSPDNDTLRLLLGHRSIRRFKQEPVPDAHIEAAIRAGQAASTSSAVQATTVLQITDADTRQRLVELTGGQSMVAACGAFFVICGDSRRHRLLARQAGQPYDARLEAFMVATIDASLFAQNMVIALESMGYGICYVGGLRNRLVQVDELLHLPHGVYPLFGLCVGVPDQDPLPRPRLPQEAVFSRDRYPEDAVLLAAIDSYDAVYRAYLQRRSGLDRSWSEGVVKAFARPRRAYLAGFYASKGADLG